MKKLKFLSVILSCLVLLSCNQKKEITLNSSIFESLHYKNYNPEKKLQYLDSIKAISNQLSNTSSNKDFLFKLSAEYYYLKNYRKSFDVCKNNMRLAQATNDTFAIARGYRYMGDCHELNRKDSAYFYYQKAEKLFRAINDKEYIGHVLYKKAYVLFYEGNYFESEIEGSKALQLLKNSNDLQMLYSCYTLMGYNFQYLEEYENALKYFRLSKTAMDNFDKTKSDFFEVENYTANYAICMANVYDKTLQYDKSIQELRSVLNEDLKKQFPNDYSVVIGNLAYSKMKKGDLENVENLLMEASSISKKNNHETNILFNLIYLGEYYSVVKDTVKSISYLKKSLQLAEKLRAVEEIKAALKLLSQVDYQHGSYYDKRYIAINDSLAKRQRKSRNKYARIEYETTVIEDENNVLSTRNLYLLVGIVVLAGAFGAWYWRSLKKELAYRKQLQAADLELFDLMKHYQIDMNAAKEEVQNRIARELHDSVMNKLYGTRLQLGMLNASNSQEAQEKRFTYIDELQLIENELRLLSHDLHTDVIGSHFDYSFLLATIVQQANAMNHIQYHFQSDSTIDWETISSLIKITIYRIVQEAISNVAKYAEANECWIAISKGSMPGLVLTISDDGKGFDTTLISQGIGLKNMKARALLVKADWTIHSFPQQGTKIECRFSI